MAWTWKDRNPSALCWTQSDESAAASAAGIPDLSLPDPRSWLQVTSDFPVPGPGGPGNTYPLFGSLSGLLSARAPGSHRLPHLVRYPEGNTPHTSHRDLNAYPSLSCTVCSEPVPTCPSLCRLAQSPRWKQRWGHDPSLLQVTLHYATDPAGIRVPEDCTLAGVSAHKVRLCPEPPGWAGARHALCFVTRSDCRD